LSLQAWWAKERVRNMGKRIVFSLLALWVHGAVLFFLTMDLFAGNNSNERASLAVLQQTVDVNLIADPAPVSPQEPLAPIISDQNPVPPIADKKAPSSKDATTKDGILGCDALTKRPQRLGRGPSFLDINPNENMSGHMVLHLTIHRDGTVIGVSIASSTMSKVLMDKIVASAYNTYFSPGEIGGVAVDCDMKYEVTVKPPVAPEITPHS
jgi:outer membrane biosynthesis protein TonB